MFVGCVFPKRIALGGPKAEIRSAAGCAGCCTLVDVSLRRNEPHRSLHCSDFFRGLARCAEWGRNMIESDAEIPSGGGQEWVPYHRLGRPDVCLKARNQGGEVGDRSRT